MDMYIEFPSFLVHWFITAISLWAASHLFRGIKFSGAPSLIFFRFAARICERDSQAHHFLVDASIDATDAWRVSGGDQRPYDLTGVVTRSRLRGSGLLDRVLCESICFRGRVRPKRILCQIAYVRLANPSPALAKVIKVRALSPGTLRSHL